MKQRIYEIRVRGELDGIWEEHFAPFAITGTASGETVLTARLDDQSVLTATLEKFQALNIEIVSVAALQGEQP